MWFILALFSGFGAALLALLVKIYLKHINPYFVTFLFSLISVLLLVLFDLITRKVHCSMLISLTAREWILFIIAGFINALAFTCYVGALQYGRPAGVVAIDRLAIVYVVVLSVIFLQESFAVKSIIGSLLMMLGALLISL